MLQNVQLQEAIGQVRGGLLFHKVVSLLPTDRERHGESDRVPEEGREP